MYFLNLFIYGELKINIKIFKLNITLIILKTSEVALVIYFKRERDKTRKLRCITHFKAYFSAGVGSARHLSCDIYLFASKHSMPLFVLLFFLSKLTPKYLTHSIKTLMVSGCGRQIFFCTSPQKRKSRGLRFGEWTGHVGDWSASNDKSILKLV